MAESQDSGRGISGFGGQLSEAQRRNTDRREGTQDSDPVFLLPTLLSHDAGLSFSREASAPLHPLFQCGAPSLHPIIATVCLNLELAKALICAKLLAFSPLQVDRCTFPELMVRQRADMPSQQGFVLLSVPF